MNEQENNVVCINEESEVFNDAYQSAIARGKSEEFATEYADAITEGLGERSSLNYGRYTHAFYYALEKDLPDKDDRWFAAKRFTHWCHAVHHYDDENMESVSSADLAADHEKFTTMVKDMMKIWKWANQQERLYDLDTRVEFAETMCDLRDELCIPLDGRTRECRDAIKDAVGSVLDGLICFL